MKDCLKSASCFSIAKFIIFNLLERLIVDP